MKPTVTWTLDLGLIGERDCEIEYDYSPAQRGSMYRSNGDPGDPPVDAEVEATKVICEGIDLTNLIDLDEVSNIIYDQVLEAESEDENEFA